MQRSYGLFEDLLNLEVNTIVKASMTAEKMPPLPFALLDIIETYAQALAEFGVPVQRYFEPSLADCWAKIQARAQSQGQGTHAYESIARARETFAVVHAGAREDERMPDCLNDLWAALEQGPGTLGQPQPFAMAAVRNGWDSFERLRIAALEHEKAVTHDHDRVIFQRIAGNCSRLKYVLQGLQQKPPRPVKPGINWLGSDERIVDAELAELVPRTRNELLAAGLRHKRIPTLLRSDDMALVRKCWEVGVERVLMQTCVQIDGDVVTRIADELIHDHAAEIRELVMHAHRQTFEVGISQWRALVEVAVQLVGKLFTQFKP